MENTEKHQADKERTKATLDYTASGDAMKENNQPNATNANPDNANHRHDQSGPGKAQGLTIRTKEMMANGGFIQIKSVESDWNMIGIWAESDYGVRNTVGSCLRQESALGIWMTCGI